MYQEWNQIESKWTKLNQNENKIERFALEENIDSIILSIDSKSRTLNLSIKELEIRDEKEALSKYGSSASGASLGDILGAALKTDDLVKQVQKIKVSSPIIAFAAQKATRRPATFALSQEERLTLFGATSLIFANRNYGT